MCHINQCLVVMSAGEIELEAFVALVSVCRLSEALIFMWGSLFESYIGSCGVVLGSQSQWSAVELGSPGQRQGAGICTSLVFGLLHS